MSEIFGLKKDISDIPHQAGLDDSIAILAAILRVALKALDKEYSPYYMLK